MFSTFSHGSLKQISGEKIAFLMQPIDNKGHNSIYNRLAVLNLFRVI